VVLSVKTYSEGEGQFHKNTLVVHRINYLCYNLTQ